MPPGIGRIQFPWSFDLSEDGAAILESCPEGATLVVCGPIHQCWVREATIGTTPVVKVGPGDRLFDI